MDRRRVRRWFVALLVLHAVVGGAGFLAPYDPVKQDREYAYLPPMRVHFLGRGHLHLRPFFYAERLREGTFDEFEEDTEKAIPLRFFSTGEQYRLLGFLPSRRHLFGAEGARLYLWGVMAWAATSSRACCMAGRFRCLRACSAQEALFLWPR